MSKKEDNLYVWANPEYFNFNDAEEYLPYEELSYYEELAGEFTEDKYKGVNLANYSYMKAEMGLDDEEFAAWKYFNNIK